MEGEKQPLIVDGASQPQGQHNVRYLQRQQSRTLSVSERIQLSWHNIDVFVQEKVQQKRCCSCSAEEGTLKQILFNVSGVVNPGTLLAIMGASGAGKSTLLNVLTHQNLAAMTIQGAVKLNGHTVHEEITSMSAYVQQEDLFIGTLTVREHLTFQSLLRLPSSVSKDTRKARVEEVMVELGLTKCADTVIGTPGRMRGISGGEKKRLAFASEILTNPSILFADEPTSGLDSFMAQSVVSCLQTLASQGRTVICTIHQPSSEVYNMFNSILLMAEGRTAYMGSRLEALEYFTGFGYPCPVNFNPADHFVMTLAVVRGEEDECKERIKKICDYYEEKEKQEATTNGSYQESSEEFAFVMPGSPYKANWWGQFKAVLWRSVLSNKRDPMLTWIKLMQSLVIGLIAGLIYWQLKNNPQLPSDCAGALFFMVTSASFGGVMGCIYLFPAELPIFLREHKTGMYRTDVYFICKTLAEFPIFVLSTFLMVLVAYWMIFSPENRPTLEENFEVFAICFGILLLCTNAALSYGYVISCLSPTVESAMAISTPLMMPLLLFGGFFIKDDSIPAYFIWLKYVSWFKYSFESININQWEKFGEIKGCPLRNGSLPRGCVASDGAGVLEFFSFEKDNYVFDLYMLAILIAAFRVLAFFILLWRSYRKN